MAILNATPDSFSDGGEIGTVEAGVARARQAVEAGAHVLDIGGESTRPGAERVSERVQIERVVPLIEAVRSAGIEVPISVDTTRAGVASAALEAGADAVNDVSGATEDPEMAALVRERSCGLVLMHRLKPPGEDSFSDRYRRSPAYPGGVVHDVSCFLEERLDACANEGIDRACVLLDPGLGFGKSVEQNLDLIRGTDRLAAIGRPVLSGLSRKSFVGRVSLPHLEQSEPSERLEGTLALSVLHLRHGARVFRVHDAGPVCRALNGAWAVLSRD